MTEVFPGVTLWERFDEDCRIAEAARDHAVAAATDERDQVVSRLSCWKLHSPERIKAAAEARFDQKMRVAQEQFESACSRAEDKLMAALDQDEKARALAEMGLRDIPSGLSSYSGGRPINSSPIGSRNPSAAPSSSTAESRETR